MRRTSPALCGELLAAFGCLVLLVVTLVWRDWIEAVFGVDPDRGSGSVEWSIVVVAAVATVGSAVLARREWLRLRGATR